MILRTFVFRVKRKKRRAVVGFMRRPSASLGVNSPLRLLRRIPACRAAFFTRNPRRKGEYLWVTVWRNQRAVRAAQKRKDWQRVMRIEVREYFAGRPKAQHFEVLLKK